MKDCEIFVTGVHTSANGTTKEWTIEDLDRIVAQFNENKPTVPIVIGHPKTNNPAYGWVDTIKRSGNKLIATFKQVNDEFAQWVNKGLYKNRSISLYPDLNLRHIGFLGAVPPAIKGLTEFQFEENQNEFEEYTVEITQNKEVDTVESVELEELKKQNSDFSEQISEKDKRIQELETKIAEQEKAKRLAEHEQFAEQLVKDGNITPAQKNYVTDFMEVCSNQGSFDFSEGEEKDVLKTFKEFLKGIKQIDFSEIANKKTADDNQDSIDFSDATSIAEAIAKRKDEYKKLNKNVSETAILAELKKENK